MRDVIFVVAWSLHFWNPIYTFDICIDLVVTEDFIASYRVGAEKGVN